MRFLQMQATPKTVIRLAYRGAQQFIGKDYPFFAAYEITQHCNIRCHGCWYYEETHLQHDGSADPDTETSVKILRRLADAHVPIVQLVGGEPFMRADLPDLLAAGHNMGLTLTVVTNGMKTTIPSLDAVDRYCEWVLFSPHVPEEIKGRRGTQHYESAWKGLDQMRAAISKPLLVSTIVVSKYTVPYLEELFERSLQAGVDKINMGANVYPHLFPNPDELESAIKIMKKWIQKYPKRFMEKESSVDAYRGYFATGKKFPCYINRHLYINVNVKGDVSACAATTAIIGNILKTPLLDMVKNRVPQLTSCNGCERSYMKSALQLTGTRM